MTNKQIQMDPEPVVVTLTEAGRDRVLGGRAGMTFLVDSCTESVGQPGKWNVHVRDYACRQPNGKEYVIWTLGPGDYEAVPAGTFRSDLESCILKWLCGRFTMTTLRTNPARMYFDCEAYQFAALLAKAIQLGDFNLAGVPEVRARGDEPPLPGMGRAVETSGQKHQAARNAEDIETLKRCVIVMIAAMRNMGGEKALTEAVMDDPELNAKVRELLR